MDYEQFKDFVQESWYNVVEITEGTLADKGMKALIKFSQSDSKVAKSMRDRGMKQAKKYEKKRDAKLTKGLEAIGNQVVYMVRKDAKRHDIEVVEATVKPSAKGTVVKVNIKFKSSYDRKCGKVNHDISEYLGKCHDRKQLLGYDYWFGGNTFNATLKLNDY